MRYVALLRGINVGGNTMINMGELRRTFEALGFENVASYINSGNLAFDIRKSLETSLVSKIENAVESRFGKPVRVMVREQADIGRILANNPYEGEYTSHKEMHVLFLNEELSADKAAQLREAAPGPEKFTIAGREIYCYLPMGVADSFLGRGLFEKKLKVAVTARNWRTVEKLAGL
jgi:uncharacterized protein (DUF1697 family)